MSNFVISTTKDNIVFTGDQNIIYIFEEVKGYEDEIYDLFVSNHMSLPQLEDMVNSWGGKLKTITLKQLIKNYYNNLQQRG